MLCVGGSGKGEGIFLQEDTLVDLEALIPSVERKNTCVELCDC